ncbi:hypothetical protein EYF80_050482 [Liparis tanakae]|uniref:Uncharacterized protein n=1 Tax=Liparis tanakae TaxID=230148 RepID=A0A4Z2FDP3_9TELE|nr:hypothetical protein EYF80_050482 [Liparis tanakae]
MAGCHSIQEEEEESGAPSTVWLPPRPGGLGLMLSLGMMTKARMPTSMSATVTVAMAATTT